MRRRNLRFDLRSNLTFGLWALIGLFAAAALGCGSESTDREVPSDDPKVVQPRGFERFTGLQPEFGDTLVPPRLGFRWEFRDLGAAPSATDPEVQESARDDVHFRLQVLDMSGAIHADHRTSEREIRVTLPPSSGPGRYVWWLEAYSAADSSKIAESVRKEFQMR